MAIHPIDLPVAPEIPRENWQDLGNCLGVDPDLFFPERGASTREAKEVCRGCEVREDCLEYALRRGEKFGIWGGTSERERRRIRRWRSLVRARAGLPARSDRLDDLSGPSDDELQQIETADQPELTAIEGGKSRRRIIDSREEREDPGVLVEYEEILAGAARSSGNPHGFSRYLAGEIDGCSCPTCHEAYARAVIVRLMRVFGTPVPYPARRPNPQKLRQQRVLELVADGPLMEPYGRVISLVSERFRWSMADTRLVLKQMASEQLVAMDIRGTKCYELRRPFQQSLTEQARATRGNNNGNHRPAKLYPERSQIVLEMLADGALVSQSGQVSGLVQQRLEISSDAAKNLLRRMEAEGLIVRISNTSKCFEIRRTDQGSAYQAPLTTEPDVLGRPDGYPQEYARRAATAEAKREAASPRRQRAGSLYEQRSAKVVAVLERGAVTDRGGRAAAKLAESVGLEAHTLRLLLAAMESEGLIVRDVKATRCYSIRLSGPVASEAEALPDELADMNPKQRAQYNRQRILALIAEASLIDLSGEVPKIVAQQLGLTADYVGMVLAKLEAEGRLARIKNSNRTFEICLPGQPSRYGEIKAAAKQAADRQREENNCLANQRRSEAMKGRSFQRNVSSDPRSVAAATDRQQIIDLLTKEGPLVDLSGRVTHQLVTRLGWKRDISYMLRELEAEERIVSLKNVKKRYEIRLPSQASVYEQRKAAAKPLRRPATQQQASRVQETKPAVWQAIGEVVDDSTVPSPAERQTLEHLKSVGGIINPNGRALSQLREALETSRSATAQRFHRLWVRGWIEADKHGNLRSKRIYGIRITPAGRQALWRQPPAERPQRRPINADPRRLRAKDNRQKALSLLADGPFVDLDGWVAGKIAAQLEMKVQYVSWMLHAMDKDGQIARTMCGKRCYEVRRPDQPSIYEEIRAANPRKSSAAKRRDDFGSHLDELLQQGSMVGPEDMLIQELAQALEVDERKEAVRYLNWLGRHGIVVLEERHLKLLEIRRPDQSSRLNEARAALMRSTAKDDTAELLMVKEQLERQLTDMTKRLGTLRAKTAQTIQAKASAIADRDEGFAVRDERIDELQQALEAARGQLRQATTALQRANQTNRELIEQRDRLADELDQTESRPRLEVVK